jgi:PBP1b-binding outer membrane lipoprotein LpoB
MRMLLSVLWSALLLQGCANSLNKEKNDTLKDVISQYIADQGKSGEVQSVNVITFENDVLEGILK